MTASSSVRVLRGEASRDQRANALRALAMDAVQQARSGHPGAPMGMAEMAVALWGRHLRHNPGNPHWINRDRFVLSDGHASMLLSRQNLPVQPRSAKQPAMIGCGGYVLSEPARSARDTAVGLAEL
ncbi:MAG: hypothetical protein EPN71_12185, partial [Rhodanobacter sp.]